MRRIFPAIFVALAMLALPAAAAPDSAPDNQLPPEIERELALPEDKIDIGEAALIFARDYYPHKVDVIRYSLELDRLADEARALTPPNATMDLKIWAVAAVIYDREGYHYDLPDGPPVPTERPSADKAENNFLPATLDLKHGACSTLPMLFLAVAQRLGLPVYPAHAPGHTYLKITNPTGSIHNWEATSNGPPLDEWIIEKYKFSSATLQRGTYMRALSYHEYLAELLALNAHAFVRSGEVELAKRYFKRALKILPDYDWPAIALADIYTSQFLNHLSTDPARAWRDFAQAQSYYDRFVAMGGDITAYEHFSHPDGGNPYAKFLNSPPQEDLLLAYRN